MIKAPLDERLKLFARENRKMLTVGEKVFWACVRNRRLNNLKFKRQTPLGQYIADFYCHDYALIVEIDGAGHNYFKDKLRDNWFAKNGFHILHLNDELVISSPELAVQKVLTLINTLTLNPSPTGEGNPRADLSPSPLGEGLGMR
jgi:very-short-patch-repair endonuclease